MSQPLTRETEDPEKILLFHITHVENLSSIIEQGGLLSFHALSQNSISPRSIAFAHLQDRREEIVVKVGAGGNLHDYVPWQFAARPPMLFSIANGKLPGINQNDIVHLITSVKKILEAELSFVFCDGHAINDFSKIYGDDQLEILPSELDWNVLHSLWWNDTPDEPDRKRKRQSEFLVRDFVPWSVLTGIATRNEVTRTKVQEILTVDSKLQSRIFVLPEWYYLL